MCIGCGCWTDTTGKAGGDGNHPDDSTKMPKVKTDISTLSTKGK